MKRFFIFYLVFSVIVVSLSCSEDDSDDSQPEVPEGTYTEFTNLPNSSNQLLGEIIVDNENATTFVYGDTDLNGLPDFVSSLAYRANNSNVVEYLIFDENQRVKYMYTEENGVRGNEVVMFDYPEDGLVNCLILDRDWGTGEQTLVNFVTVETDTEEFVANPILTRMSANDSSLFDVVLTSVKLVVGVLAAVAVSIPFAAVVGVKLAVAGGIVVFLTTASAIADEGQTQVGTDPDGLPPNEPDETISDPCEDADIDVVIGVDPGNLLVAIVSGDSVDYDFFWSTGETGTGLASDTIVAPGDGNYYVVVQDDNGCFGFGAVSINSNPVEIDPSLLTNKLWFLTGERENGQDVFDPSLCNITIEFTNNELIATEFFGDDCEFADDIASDYTLDGNIITETEDGDSSIITILELTSNKLVLQEVEDGFIYEETYSYIFGDWTIAATDCDGTDVVYTGPFTLNSDFTVTQEDDSNGNYITNSFSFENNVVSMLVEYMDPTCDGDQFVFQRDTATLTFDNFMNTFSGTGTTTKDGIDVLGCFNPPSSCTYDVTLNR